ncbi:lantibiotic dehydratase [Myxococcaceae bacterium GXIMD 01537]
MRARAERGTVPEVRPAGFFQVRTPLLPVSVAREWLQRARAEGGGALPLARSLPADVRSALTLASPALAQAWSMPPEPGSRSAAAIERAVLSYLLRASHRPTPFGWLAGCTVGAVGEHTELRVSPRERWKRRLRLAWPVVERLAARAQELLRDAPLRYEPQSTVYTAGDEVRFTRLGPDGRWAGFGAVPATAPLLTALEAAREGLTLEALGRAVLRASGCPEDALGTELVRVMPFIHSLVDAGLLVSELTPPVTGSEPLAHLSATVRRLQPAHPLVGRLEALERELDAPLDDVERLSARVEQLLELPAEPEGSLFDAHLIKPADAVTLGPAPLGEMVRVARFLQRLGSSEPRRELRDFAQRFTERFGMRAIPLTVAVDPQHGVGFGDGRVSTSSGTLLQPLGASAPRPGLERELTLTRLALEALGSQGLPVLRLTDDLPGLAPSEERELPSRFVVMTTLAAASAARVDAGDFRLVRPLVATGSAAALFARFCHADATLHPRVLELVRAEEDAEEDVLLADVVLSTPGARGGIALRPVLYSHELVCGGRSGAPPDKVLRPSELLVTVRGERVVLYSPRHGRRVSVRIANTVDGANTLFPPLYRFLAALGFQDAGIAGGWEWGSLRQMPRLPRVEYGRSILAPATWNLPGSEAGGPSEVFDWARALRERYALPRRVALVTGDQALSLDLESEPEAEFLRRKLRQERAVTLTEDLPDDSELVVEGAEGRYRHELLVPFLASRPSTPPRAPVVLLDAEAEAERTHAPGGEVLYVRLHADPLSQDAMLPLLQRFAHEALRQGQARGWHFLRYRDPEPHLRFRLLGVAPGATGPLMESLHTALAEHRRAGRLWRTGLDTYERELERYGGREGMALAERLFELDSDTSVQLLRALEQTGAPASARALAVAFSAHALLKDLVPEARPRLDILEGLERAYLRELSVGPEGGRELGERYRAQGRALGAIVTGAGLEKLFPPPVLKVVATRSEAVRETWARYAALLNAQGPASVPRVVESLVHVHLWRLRGEEVRREELILYALLRRASWAAMQREASHPASSGPTRPRDGEQP